MYKGIKPSSQWLPPRHQPTLPTSYGSCKPLTYSSLVSSCLSLPAQQHIMEEALGKEETIPVNSIVTATGFNSYTSFYRIFRQYTGLTPNEYIAQLKKEKKRPHSRLS